MESKQAPNLPKDLAKLVERTWPDGVVEQFDTSESYFYEIQDGIRGALLGIRDSAEFWETPDPYSRHDRDWDDDDDDFGSGNEDDFQSYHVFFVSPGGEGFVVPEETQGYADPEDPDAQEPEEATYSGERTEGYAVGISLLAPVAAISWSSTASVEDGSFENPDLYPPGLGEAYEDPGEEPPSQPPSEEARQKMERLRNAIAAVLQKHKIRLLDEASLSIPVAGLRAGEEVFLSEPLHLFDAFFFRGV
ncbi:MAG: hypothetical protein ACLQU1_42565 [Bryobacteraceae bacterium]